MGWLLFFVFVTGITGYLQQEIMRWMRPECSQEVATGSYDNAVLTDLTEQADPVADSWSVILPHQEASEWGWSDFPIRWRRT